MRPYELLLVLKPTLEDEAVDAFLERLMSIVTSENGQIDNVDKWGKRRLAYEIKGFTEGFYVVIKFTAATETANEVERVIKITDEVIRHMLVRDDR